MLRVVHDVVQRHWPSSIVLEYAVVVPPDEPSTPSQPARMVPVHAVRTLQCASNSDDAPLGPWQDLLLGSEVAMHQSGSDGGCEYDGFTDMEASKFGAPPSYRLVSAVRRWVTTQGRPEHCLEHVRTASSDAGAARSQAGDRSHALTAPSQERADGSQARVGGAGPHTGDQPTPQACGEGGSGSAGDGRDGNRDADGDSQVDPASAHIGVGHSGSVGEWHLEHCSRCMATTLAALHRHGVPHACTLKHGAFTVPPQQEVVPGRPVAVVCEATRHTLETVLSERQLEHLEAGRVLQAVVKG